MHYIARQWQSHPCAWSPLQFTIPCSPYCNACGPPPVNFVSCITPIQILTCCSELIAVPKPPTWHDLMLSYAIRIMHPISLHFAPFQSRLRSRVPNWSFAFPLRMWTTMYHSGRITTHLCLCKVSTSRSLSIGYQSSVHWNRIFTALWWSYPPSTPSPLGDTWWLLEPEVQGRYFYITRA